MTTTEQFMAALTQAETTGDTGALLALHAPGVTLRNLTEKVWEGAGGTADFWATYLANFQDIRSEFTHHHEAHGLGVMEWVARGHVRGGREVEYRGVSLIEVEGGLVQAFRTYYDSAAFVVPAVEGQGAAG